MSKELMRVNVDYTNFMLLDVLSLYANNYNFHDSVIDDKLQDLINYLYDKLYPDLQSEKDYIDIVGYALYEEFEVEKSSKVFDSIPSLLNAIKNGRVTDSTSQNDVS